MPSCEFHDLHEFSTLCLLSLEYVITKREIRKFHVVVLHLNDGKDVYTTITAAKIHLSVLSSVCHQEEGQNYADC